jgi:hypothetical protein
MKELTPTSYHAYAQGTEELIQGCWHKNCCLPCSIPCRKREVGFMLLQDLTKTETPFHVLDKNEIPTIEHVMMVMRAAGNYHGAMWQLLNGMEEAFGKE